MPNGKKLAFEIGTEEIPAFDLKNATEKFAPILQKMFDDQNIPHGNIEIYSTPRRMIAIIDDVAAKTEAIEQDFRGPKAAAAFDDDGKPTKAAEGFARGKGVDPITLERREVDGVEYVFAHVSIPSYDTKPILAKILRDSIDAIQWPKSMKWNVHHELFTRPVRWLVALFDDEILDIEYAGLKASNETYGHRVLSPGPHKVPNAGALIDVISSIHVVPTEDAREKIIKEGVTAIEKKLDGINVVMPQKTLTEVINLSEYPTVMLGEFDEKFLEVPEEIIVDAMIMHQRYFPIYRDGKLTNNFIIISNGDPEFEGNIVDGNERVVAARLYDAMFFYTEDLKLPLENYVERLDDVVFQEQLGTMRDKTSRITQLAQKLCLDASFSAVEKEDVARAALLAKADLVTNAVIEFTSVQGVMGSYYAIASGENEAVAIAIADHYKPRFSGDEIPSNVAGKVVAVADKIDTICGLFALGQEPTGSSDPFAIRRAALGVIAILSQGLEVSLVRAIDESCNIYLESGLEFNKTDVVDRVVDFFVTRTQVMLHDDGNDTDVINAVLAAGVKEPVEITARTVALSNAIKESPELFEDLGIAFSRANNLRDEKLGTDVDETLFNDDERALDKAIKEVGTQVEEALDQDLFAAALEYLAGLRKPIDDFFESTMVMDEDAKLRDNRIRLLNRFVDTFADVADFSEINFKKQ